MRLSMDVPEDFLSRCHRIFTRFPRAQLLYDRYQLCVSWRDHFREKYHMYVSEFRVFVEQSRGQTQSETYQQFKDDLSFWILVEDQIGAIRKILLEYLQNRPNQ